MYQKIKEILIENTDLLISILEDSGFSDISNYTNEIRCALPDGDNFTSVQIYKDTLYANVWSRNNFYDDFEIQDVISLIAFAKGISIHKSKDYLCNMLGLDTEKKIEFKKSQAIKAIKKYKEKKKDYNVKILPEEILNRFRFDTVKEWEDEGIDTDTQRIFEVHSDDREKRWCFTLRDWDGNLIGRKGRTWVKDFELLKIPKYLYYHSNGGFAHLYNIHRAIGYIERENEVIIVESEKSVMKLWSMGFKNVVAIGNKKVSPFMSKQLLKLKCSNFVFALDKDVDFESVKKEAMKFKMFKNIWIVFDDKGLLNEKDSPCDRGFITWLDLYSKKVKVGR